MEYLNKVTVLPILAPIGIPTADIYVPFQNEDGHTVTLPTVLLNSDEKLFKAEVSNPVTPASISKRMGTIGAVRFLRTVFTDSSNWSATSRESFQNFIFPMTQNLKLLNCRGRGKKKRRNIEASEEGEDVDKKKRRKLRRRRERRRRT